MENLIKYDGAVVISDLHVADPDIDPALRKRGLDDFDRDEDFARLLGKVIPDRAGWPATLIINGDFIDFIQILPGLARHSVGDRYGVTQNDSRLKLERVIKGHPLVFDAMSKFLQANGQILILPGNHDIDLHWPNVFEDLRKRLGNVPEPMLRFVKEAVIEEQRVYIEHGNQYSYDNRFDSWLNPISLAPDDRERLERPWGTMFLDYVYNDFKDLYPFSNKVYPHWRLAWIALSSFKDDKNVSPRAIARLILFFSRKGKRFLWEHMMGAEDENTAVPIEAVWKRLGPVDNARQSKISAEINSLISETNDVVPIVANVPENVSVMMGRDDDKGMKDKHTELLRSGEVDVVAFGHTHTAVDGNKNPLFGTDDKRRYFNTGSWVPNIPIGNLEKPKWKDLETKPGIPDIWYLVLKFKPQLTAWLEQLQRAV